MSYWQNFLTSHLSYKAGDSLPSGVRRREGINGEPVWEVGSLTPDSDDRRIADQIVGPNFKNILGK